jgi:hypothetical protein
MVVIGVDGAPIESIGSMSVEILYNICTTE